MNIKDNFENNGYIKIDNFLSDNNNFIKISEELHIKLQLKISKYNLNDLGGYKIGNINVHAGKYSKKIWELLIKNNLDDVIIKILNKSVKDFRLDHAGNLSFPGKGSQQFHTDGNFEDTMYLVSVATENITYASGPTEVISNLHQSKTPYWKFIISKKKKEIIPLKKGDILIRKHCVWHRGTKNKSSNSRFLLTYLLHEKSNKFHNKFDNSSEIFFYNNFFKSDVKGKIKEFLYVKFGFIFFLYKFMRSIF